MKRVTVIDYGIGNILSVCRAIEYFGAQVVLSGSPQEIIKAERLVLPGVGAFADGMEGLHQRGLVEAIQEYACTGRPFLGICLGMQMMMESSEEFGNYKGLGLIKGTVLAVPPRGSDGVAHKIPHIGWNELLCPPGIENWQGTILEGIPQGSSMYFVHSFTAVPDYAENRLADTNYNGCVISAAIRSSNLYGCQFHPEKSGKAGLGIIRNFLNI